MIYPPFHDKKQAPFQRDPRRKGRKAAGKIIDLARPKIRGG